MRNPLKQGLKLLDQMKKITTEDVAMRNPLKQGLKQHFGYTDSKYIEGVAMRNPLKQGLKQ